MFRLVDETILLKESQTRMPETVKSLTFTDGCARGATNTVILTGRYGRRQRLKDRLNELQTRPWVNATTVDEHFSNSLFSLERQMHMTKKGRKKGDGD